MHDFLIVILNGPPHCGKDTIISKLITATTPYCILNHRHVRGWHEKMISPLKDVVCGLFNLSGYTYETMKDEPILPNHVSPREAIIHLERHWSRELFGEDFLGRLLISELEKHHKKKPSFEAKNQINIHFVDAGVEAEFKVLKNMYENRVKVLHIYRNGLEFTDSRHYLSQCDGTIYNVEGQIDKAVDDVLIAINYWLEDVDADDTGVAEGVSKEG